MLTRRSFFTGLALIAAAQPAAAEHPSVGYLRQVAKDMLAAHRQGTISAFLRAIQRHADLNGIGKYVLGNYIDKLPSSQLARYNRGVANYMALFFANGSRDYTVAKYDIGEATVDADKNVLVDSTIYLLTGRSYNATWKLVWINGGYKVRDVRVLGFWMTAQQKSDFANFLGSSKPDHTMNDLLNILTKMGGR
jgi:phospholipid transport system substrate-binding protein